MFLQITYSSLNRIVCLVIYAIQAWIVQPHHYSGLFMNSWIVLGIGTAEERVRWCPEWSGRGPEGVNRCCSWAPSIKWGETVAGRSVLKHLTVNSYRKCIKCMDQTAIRRPLPTAQRLFEQLLNSSQALSILFRLEYFPNLTIQAWIVFKPHYSGHYSWIVTYSRASLPCARLHSVWRIVR